MYIFMFILHNINLTILHNLPLFFYLMERDILKLKWENTKLALKLSSNVLYIIIKSTWKT